MILQQSTRYVAPSWNTNDDQQLRIHFHSPAFYGFFFFNLNTSQYGGWRAKCFDGFMSRPIRPRILGTIQSPGNLKSVSRPKGRFLYSRIVSDIIPADHSSVVLRQYEKSIQRYQEGGSLFAFLFSFVKNIFTLKEDHWKDTQQIFHTKHQYPDTHELRIPNSFIWMWLCGFVLTPVKDRNLRFAACILRIWQ